MTDKNKKVSIVHEELPEEHDDPLIRFLHQIIRLAIKTLAILMVLIIIWGVADVVFVVYQRLVEPPFLLLSVNDIFQVFAAFMVVLIAVEIFINIRLYLGTNVLPIQLVIATALMAIARKVIILDFDTITPNYIMGIAAVVLALGVSYWLVSKKSSH
ncbi:phosphate-starvation-inducible PsiE family protein [Bacterioplanoides sp. SCSIO 12839]|uniref:phosphate-starvation-inducible PsiE family protein n=1 Tax=Bacterioplanoides sp. SCSIO 12839 TaxID=2829569 RepID=UPI002105D5C5|nr:phosphate-starvation-inducible PsiE family protein [Bacterioplanoides sp. SCSIO 12839]UTW47943.1 phosphate-starvation-inducible PsiE family protein [Bacterioplanoides sp. SCSIO 12839]